MRILLLSHYYAPEIGAPQRRWSALVREWRALGHEVTVLTSMPHYPHPDLTEAMRAGRRPYRRETGEHGETVIRMPYLPHGKDVLTRTLDHFYVSLQSLTMGLLRAGGGHDVVITTVPALTSLFAGHVAARLLRAPLVVEMRDAWPDLVTFTPGISQGRGITGALRSLTHRWVTRLQLGSHQVVTTSSRFAGILAARGVESVTVIRNGADLSTTPDLAPAARRLASVAEPGPSDAESGPSAAGTAPSAAGLTPSTAEPDLSAAKSASSATEPGTDPDGATAPARRTLKVLYLGTLGRSQGLSAIIDAAGMASAGGVDLRLRFVGAGAEREALEERARESLADITFLDPVPHREVAEHYGWADTVAVSLRDWAPFRWTVPSKLYELLATNVHVSALVSGESAEIVRAADAGFVAAPGDAKALARHWMEAAADRSVLDHGGAGRRWVAEHTDNKDLSARYLRLLEAAHRGHRAARAIPASLRGSTEGPRASDAGSVDDAAGRTGTAAGAPVSRAPEGAASRAPEGAGRAEPTGAPRRPESTSLARHRGTLDPARSDEVEYRNAS
ncbi:glycosyltransferase family 4 protein [Rothia sp. AR01]|uniref:D-inositol 3-phosphate glycosyltransferase n=1 Tax=Rothia santali TaxID=2949643 RepID=A0A9X2HJR7_9MICC|nr:glycosyltransferase family 4 protein [Rothia santali]MCP3426198.1 glycosyltransferase family 4 protein [Rothia santali]